MTPTQPEEVADQVSESWEAAVGGMMAGRLPFGRLDELVAEATRDELQLLAPILSDQWDAAPSVERLIDLGRLWVAIGHRLGFEARAATFVADRMVEREHYAAGLPFAERAIELLAGRNDDEEVRARRLRLACLVGSSSPDATGAAEEVVSLARAVGDLGELAMALYEQARALQRRGIGAAALRAATEASAFRSKLPPGNETSVYVASLGRFEMTRGEIARDIGSYEEAILAFEAGRRAFVDAAAPAAAAWCLSELGFTWSMAGDAERGERLLMQAADEAERAGDLENARRWQGKLPAPSGEAAGPARKLWTAMALAKDEPARLDEAITLARQCVQEARRSGMSGLEVQARNALGGLLAQADRLHEAVVALRAASGVAARLGNIPAEFHIRTNLANVLGRMVHWQEAEAELDAAVDLYERLRDEAESDELRQTLSGALSRAYEQLIFLASSHLRRDYDATGHPAEQSPRPEMVLELCQRLAARNLTGSLNRSQVVGDAPPVDLVEGLLALRAADVALEEAAQRSQDLAARLAARRNASDRFAALARCHGLDLEQAHEAWTVDEIKKCLQPGECVVDLIPLNEGISVLCMSSAGSISVDAATWPREDRIAFLRRLARVRRRAAEDDIEPELGGSAAGLAALKDELRSRLFDLVHEEIDGHGTADRVLVVAHNELAQIPYWELASQRDGVTISVLPAISTLVQLRRRVRPAGGRPWIVVGDATKSLRFVDREVAGIGDFERCAGQLTRCLAGCGRAHFAAHGYFDSENPYRSGVVVGVDAGEPPGEEVPDPEGRPGLRLFSVAEILSSLHMPRCRLVVLSACNTGLSRLHPASEFTSLPAAFLVAGARNVIGALWPAHDGAAALLMQELYASMRDGVESPARALRAARETLASMGRDEVVQRLGTEQWVPRSELPFAGSPYTDAFQHYGVD